jgi:hypothetical protein
MNVIARMFLPQQSPVLRDTLFNKWIAALDKNNGSQ